MDPQRYRCKHPHTEEWVEMTNGEWRRAKALLPLDCSLWMLLAAEEEFEILITAISEYPHDTRTMQWLVGLLKEWPSKVYRTPQTLLAWYSYVWDYFDLPSVVQTLEQAELLLAKKAKLDAGRKKVVTQIANKLQREIKKLQKMKARQAKIKARRAKLARRR